MKGIVCSVCGYIALDGSAPESCPVCHSPKKVFKEDENAIVVPSTATDKVEANKKHIPIISVTKACGLLGNGCTDVSIKTGEIPHPMLPEHHIAYMDAYIDKKFISRISFSPEKMNAAIGLHLKASNCSFQIISKCNLHGAWLSEAKI